MRVWKSGDEFDREKEKEAGGERRRWLNLRVCKSDNELRRIRRGEGC